MHNHSFKPPIIRNFLREQSLRPLCQVTFCCVRTLFLEFSVNKRGILVCCNFFNVSLQSVALQWLLKYAFYLFNYQQIAGHSAQERMYDSLRHKAYCLYIAQGVYTAVKHFGRCPRYKTCFKQKRSYVLFASSGASDFVFTDSLSSKPRARNGN